MIDSVLFWLVIYLLILVGVAIFFSRKEGINSYLLNNRKTIFWLFSFAAIATIVGAGAIVAAITEVYRNGISYGIGTVITLIAGTIILGVFEKKMREFGEKQGVCTIVNFFDKRFDNKNRKLSLVIQLGLNI